MTNPLTTEELKRPSIKVAPGMQPVTVDEFYAMVASRIDRRERGKTFCYFEREAQVVSRVRG